MLALTGEAVSDGRLYIYERVAGAGWTLANVIDAPPLQNGSFTNLAYGIDLALDGDLLVANEPGRGGGAVYVYRHDGAGWTLEQTLSRERGELGPVSVFGNRIALSGERLVAAAPARVYDGRSLGAAFVYARGTDGVWTLEAELRASEPFIGFARDVAIQGDRVLVGANNTDEGRGYLFTRSGGVWAPSE